MLIECKMLLNIKRIRINCPLLFTDYQLLFIHNHY